MKRWWVVVGVGLWVSLGAISGLAATTTYVGQSVWGGIAMSSEGRFIAFGSIVRPPEGGEPTSQVLVRDLSTGQTEVVSLAHSGEMANLWSDSPAISADGRFVAFASQATNLAPDSAGSGANIFLRDRLLGTTTRISSGSDRQPANGWCDNPVISADGRYVAFASAAGNLTWPPREGDPFAWNVFVHDCRLGTTERVPPPFVAGGYRGTYHTPRISMSADGRYVAFDSGSDDLVPEDHNYMDVFVYDRARRSIELASRNSAGEQADADCEFPALSADGRFVAFMGYPSNFFPGEQRAWHVYLRDRETGLVERITVDSQGQWNEYGGASPHGLAVSPDGRYVAFTAPADGLVAGSPGSPGDDVILRDRVSGITQRMSVSSEGVTENFPSGLSGVVMSTDGRYVAFETLADNLTPEHMSGTVLRDRLTFADVPPAFWAFYEVDACHAAGLVQGFADGSYRPKGTVTRGQMAAYLARAMCGGEEYVPTGPASASFSDVALGDNFYRHIEYCHAQGIATGYGDDTYQPSWTVNRGQMAAFLARALAGGEEQVPTGPAQASFDDVPPTFAFYDHVEYIYSQGVTTGKADGLYHPEEACLRDQMAVFIARAFALRP